MSHEFSNRMVHLGLTCLVSLVVTMSATAQEKRPRLEQPKDAKEAVALAEAQVAIKQAAVKVADAHKRIAEAKLGAAADRIQGRFLRAGAANDLAQLGHRTWAKQRQRAKAIYQAGVGHLGGAHW